MARDIYTRLNEIDDTALRTIAQMLERRGNHPQQVAIRTAYLDALGDLSGLRVLEVGCGTGVITRDLARRVGAHGSVVGSDPSHGMIAVARELAVADGLPELRFEVQDATALPYADAAFDLVCVITVLSHVPARERLLREVVRVTRPGGRVLVVDGDFAANQIAHPDRALTTAIVDAWRASVVDDPQVTRRLGPLLTAAGLQPKAFNGHVHLEAGHADDATSFILPWAPFAAQQAVQAGAVTESEASGWVAGVLALNEQGLLFGSVNFVSAICDRP
ncbi:MAG: methyltransferase domain-containing protein [Chloroflexi bacterium]|nr:methyltransferase domain-containing protein [Chloroflexota bacterium]